MELMIRRRATWVVVLVGVIGVAVGTSLAINAACVVCTNGFRPLYPDELTTQNIGRCQTRAALACATCSVQDIINQCGASLLPYRPSWLDRILIPFL